MKKPWLAALFNIILFGLGYLYIGTRTTFTLFLLASSIAFWIFFIGYSFIPCPSEWCEAPWILFDWLWLLSVLLLISAFAIDAYKEAQLVNSNASKRRPFFSQ